MIMAYRNYRILFLAGLGVLKLALAGCATSGVPAPTQDSKLAVAQVQVRQVATACEKYKQDKGSAPERLNQLVPDYLELIANDPWGKKFVYPVEQGTCEVVSRGPDGLQTISSKGELPTAYTK
jgi:hypothetical protein